MMTMDDGTVLSCTPQEFGSPDASHMRWRIVEASDRKHTGPPYSDFISQTELHRLICDWWAARHRPPEGAPVPASEVELPI